MTTTTTPAQAHPGNNFDAIRIGAATMVLVSHHFALTGHMEQDRPDPWAVSDAPETYIASQLRGIVGLEIDVTTMQGKWKAGQNRVEADRKGIADALIDTHPTLSAAALRTT